MSEPRIKSRLESVELTGKPTPIQEKLNACLISDPAHIQPGQRRNHIKIIQDALTAIGKRTPGIDIPVIKDARDFTGPTQPPPSRARSFSLVYKKGAGQTF